MPYNDEYGNEPESQKMSVPKMCLICERNYDPDEDVLCDLHRRNERENGIFKCGAFSSLYGPLIDDIIL